MNIRRTWLVTAGLLGTALAAAACGSGSGADTSAPAVTHSNAPGTLPVKGNLAFVGIWSGAERKNFERVLSGFHTRYPQVTVKYLVGR